jgi:hypothetical protein
MTWLAVGAGVGAATGLSQIIFSGKKKKEKELEAQAANAPKYGGDQGISEYYQQSKEKANTAAQQSALFKQGQQLQQRNLASGLAGSNIAKGGQGLVSNLVQGANDASMRNLVGAEAQKERRFGQLGQATQMKSADEMRKFQINQQQPWETKYNLLAAKAAKAAEQQQAGFANISGAATGLITGGVAKYNSKSS